MISSAVSCGWWGSSRLLFSGSMAASSSTMTRRTSSTLSTCPRNNVFTGLLIPILLVGACAFVSSRHTAFWRDAIPGGLWTGGVLVSLILWFHGCYATPGYRIRLRLEEVVADPDEYNWLTGLFAPVIVLGGCAVLARRHSHSLFEQGERMAYTEEKVTIPRWVGHGKLVYAWSDPERKGACYCLRCARNHGLREGDPKPPLRAIVHERDTLILRVERCADCGSSLGIPQ